MKVAHTFLEPGVREAFEAVIERYENLHLNITVKQMPIPERVYTIWLETKLFGGIAPDIIFLGPGALGNEDLLGYILPIDRHVEEPNPYNDSTEFENVPWKDTFIDGLCCSQSYNTNLLATFGVPVTIVTTRHFYNRDLLQKIAGYPNPPDTFGEFIELCRGVEEYRKKSGEPVFALAGSEVNAYLLFRSLLGSQTQRLTYLMEPTNELNGLNADTIGANLGGWWTLRNPEIVAGLSLVKEFADYYTPGFQQLKRDDALFQFVQGHAVMIVAQSKEAGSIEVQAPFEIGVSQIPLPSPNNPDYGEFMLGPQTEAKFGSQPPKKTLRTPLKMSFAMPLTSIPCLAPSLKEMRPPTAPSTRASAKSSNLKPIRRKSRPIVSISWKPSRLKRNFSASGARNMSVLRSLGDPRKFPGGGFIPRIQIPRPDRFLGVG